MRSAPIAALAGLLLAPACGSDASTLVVQSPAFDAGGAIPAKYSEGGDDTSPPLSWSDGPGETAGYALIVEDPDAPAGTWIHWVAWNIAASELPAGIAPSASEPRQGLNSWGRVGYGGPAPPSGTHRYLFRVYALDQHLELPPTTDARALRKAMAGHVLASGELMGRYARP